MIENLGVCWFWGLHGRCGKDSSFKFRRESFPLHKVSHEIRSPLKYLTICVIGGPSRILAGNQIFEYPYERSVMRASSCSPPSTLRTLSQERLDLQQPLPSKCAPTNRQRPPSEHEDLVQSSRKSPPDNYETKSDSLSELTKSGILKCVSYQPAAETLGTLMQMLTAKKYLHKRICFSASDPSIPSPWKTRMRAHRRPKEGDR